MAGLPPSSRLLFSWRAWRGGGLSIFFILRRRRQGKKGKKTGGKKDGPGTGISTADEIREDEPFTGRDCQAVKAAVEGEVSGFRVQHHFTEFQRRRLSFARGDVVAGADGPQDGRDKRACAYLL